MHTVCNYARTYIIHKHYSVILYIHCIMHAVLQMYFICPMHTCAVFTYSVQLPKEMCKQLA